MTYSEKFQAMVKILNDEEVSEDRNGDELSLSMRKKRLCIEQVKGLEKHFEEENRLHNSGRKVKIAEELGLEPRQVAVWFQNRRARSKNKQLERDYDKLRACFDDLKQDYGSLQQEITALLSQVNEMKTKIKERERSVVEINDDLNILTTSSTSTSVWMDEDELGIMFDEQDSCTFFSFDQPPTFHFY